MTEPKTAEVKVVPVEPTEAMLNAGTHQMRTGGPDSMPSRLWSAMLSAAPSHIGEAAGMANQVEHAFAALEKFRDYGYAQWSVGAAIDVLRAAMAAPGSPAEKGEVLDRLQWDVQSAIDNSQDGLSKVTRDLLCRIRSDISTHPASDQSDTDRMRDIIRRLVALPDAQKQLRSLDRGISTSTPVAVWLEARAALAEKEAGQ